MRAHEDFVGMRQELYEDVHAERQFEKRGHILSEFNKQVEEIEEGGSGIGLVKSRRHDTISRW